MSGRSDAARPRRGALLGALLLALLAAGIAAGRWHTYDEPLERDVTLYAEIGRELLAGRALYADLWDHKPPGVHAAYALAQAAVGPGRPAVYLLAVAAGIAGLLAVYAAGRAGGARLANAGAGHAGAGRGAGLLAAALWALLCGDLGLEANQPNTEVFLNAAAAAGLALLLAAPARVGPDLARFAAVGLVFALASLFKQVILAVAAGLALAHLACPPPGATRGRARLAELALAAGVGAAAWALVTAWFAATGRLGDFVDAMWTYNRFHASDGTRPLTLLEPAHVVPAALRFALPLAAAALAGALWARRSGGAARPWWLLGGYAVGVFAAVAAPGKFFPHYYQLWLPVLAIGPAWAAAALWDRPSHRAAGAALGLASLGWAAWHALPPYALAPAEWSLRKYGDVFIEVERVGREIDARLPPGETFFQWGNDSGLYFASGRRPSTGILFVKPLVKGPLTAELSLRTLEALRRDPPALLVTRRRWVALAGPDHPVLGWLLTHYAPLPDAPPSAYFDFYARRERSDRETARPSDPAR